MHIHILSSYRAYLRQVRALPHRYLRIKGADDFRSALKADSPHLRKKKLSRISKDLRRLQAANAGESVAFDRMLDIAYGRVGKLRWELMQPFFLSANAPLPPQVNPQVRSPPPVYSPELAALLTSGVSRTARALQKHHLVSPPALPPRAQLDSEDAALLGSLSRRREYNVRWRFFRSEWKKVYPPLQISLQHLENHTNQLIPSEATFGRDFRDMLMLRELIVLAGSPSRLPDPTRRQKPSGSSANPFDGSLPIRWLRRRYQALLGRLPILISRPSPQGNSKYIYDVQLADNAITTSRSHPSQLRAVDAKDLLWLCDVHPAAHPGRRGT